MVKVTTLLIKPESTLGFVFRVRAQITGVCTLKVVSGETNLGVEGL